MTTAILEEKVDIEINKAVVKLEKLPEQGIKITPAYAERIAKRFGIDLKKAGLPNYSDKPNYSDNLNDDSSYLRWFEDLEVHKARVNGKQKRVLTGSYFVQTFLPTPENSVITLEPKSFYFVID